jgi:hypothetical protein
MNLLSWDYPKDNNLKTKNDIDCLYPVTCLTTLSKGKILILLCDFKLVNNSKQLGRMV